MLGHRVSILACLLHTMPVVFMLRPCVSLHPPPLCSIIRSTLLSHCRYAQQEPELPGTSTVWEYLRFHARLRMPEEQKRNNGDESRVWGVVSQLGLNKVIFFLVSCCSDAHTCKCMIPRLESCCMSLLPVQHFDQQKQTCCMIVNKCISVC